MTTVASTSPVRKELRRLTSLAAPVVASQVASLMLWVVDLLMITRVGVEELDAASLGRMWITASMLFAMGLLLGMDPIATQAHGSGDRKRLEVVFSKTVRLALLISVPICASYLLSGEILVGLGQEPHLSAAAERYCLAQIIGLPMYLLFIVLRQYLQAQGIMKPAMWVAVIANGVNALANWALIWGNFGFPELGLEGAGIATAITEAFMVLAMALIARWIGQSKTRADKTRPTRPVSYARILRYGFPIAVQITLEMSAFSVAMLFAGRLGVAQLGAHSIAINLASLSFMMPLGISLAVVTRVGNLIGAGDREGAQRASWIGMAMGAGVMIISAIGFTIGRRFLPGLYTDDAVVLAMCASILPIAAAFQLFDGLQVVGAAVLRGMGKTLPAAIFNLLGYYVLALPLAAWLAFGLGQGLDGIWWGLTLGLAAVAAMVTIYVGRRGPASLDPSYTVDSDD